MFKSVTPSWVLAGASLVPLGEMIQIAAGLLAVIYSSMKIYDWIKIKWENKQ